MLKLDLVDVQLDVLTWLLESDGVLPWLEFENKFMDEFDDDPIDSLQDPLIMISRLTDTGLVFLGMLDNIESVFVPADLRPLLGKLLV